MQLGTPGKIFDFQNAHQLDQVTWSKASGQMKSQI